LDALLDFQVGVTLDGDALTGKEIKELLASTDGLALVRGKWVEVNRERLQATLDRFQEIERLSRREGVPFGQAMRLLAGAEIEGGAVAEPTAQWAHVQAGPWLAAALEACRSPDGLARVSPGEALQATLRPYQETGLRWLYLLNQLGLGACLADDMGLGKTIQVIALHLHREGHGPTLVVCPTSLLGNWAREIARFAPTLPVRRYHGGGRHLDDLAKNEIVLVTYGIVRNDAPVIADAGWGLIVADEAQYVKNPLSRTARQLRTLAAGARLALSGTPVENRLSELWSVLDWTTPGLLGSLDHFQSAVAVPVERFRDPDATERLARLVRPFLLRRRKSDPGIAPELPAKTETDRIVPLGTEQASLYQAVVSESLDAIAHNSGITRRGLVLKLLTGLKQICNHPAQFLHEPGPIPGRSGKLDALDDLLDVILAEGESVLVFSQYVQMCRLIEAHLAARHIGSLFLHGQTADRDRIVADFQAGKAPVFLLSLRAGGVGLNLTKATHVVHYDRWWNPAVEDQATDRAYRIGQDRPVQVHRLITEGTVEDRIATLLATKRLLAESVVGTGEDWLTELSTEALADLVRLDPP
jgi:SNF2 family DNA or RNA helicase